MKLAAIAARLQDHLSRFEGDAAIATSSYLDARGVLRRLTRYFNACAYVAGSRIAVVYISYQGRSTLTRSEALAYLAWLDAGNVGSHYEALAPIAKAEAAS